MQPAHPAGGEIHSPHPHVLVLEPQMRRDRAINCLLSPTD